MKKNGFTAVELVVTIGILAIMAAVAIPGFSRWQPDQKLKSAAWDLYGKMQLTKLGAVRANSDWAIVFNVGANNYYICSDPGDDDDWTTVVGSSSEENEIVQGPVSLTDYKYGVSYGHGSAGTAIPGGTAWDDDVTYSSPNNVVVFNPRGTSNGGYVYLDNDKNQITYGVGTRTTGVIRVLKWNNGAWE